METKKSYLPFILIGAVLAAVLAVTLLMLRSNADDTRGGATGNAGPGAASTNAAGIAPPAGPLRREAPPGAQPPHAKGREGASVVLEEFADYQCPPCAGLHPVLQKIEEDYGDRVRVVFRNFPLQQIHKNAFSAARAAEAAGMQGKFWEMNDLIYDTQDQWKDSAEPRPTFESYARRLDLNVEKFKADTDSPQVTARVVADYNRGGALGVSGTPTVFLNGRELKPDDTLVESRLRAKIDEALAGK